MEMMLSEGHAVVAVLVEVTGLLSQVAQHALVKIGAPACHSSTYLSLVADARQVKDANFHFVTSSVVA
jgi:hypothetical protein